jgi:polyisoprenoid-binding protein YceI
MPLIDWTIEPHYSAVLFVARHMVVARVHGRFERLSGTLRVDPARPQEGEVRVRIDAASVNTAVPDRDTHLRSADFLDVERAPSIEFRSTGVEPVAGSAFRVLGELTLRNVTRPVVLEARHLATTTDPWGQQRLLFSARTTLNRSDFGIQWNRALDNGGWLVGEKLDVDLDLQAVPTPPK